jgi:hypothetical protein
MYVVKLVKAHNVNRIIYIYITYIKGMIHNPTAMPDHDRLTPLLYNCTVRLHCKTVLYDCVLRLCCTTVAYDWYDTNSAPMS